MPIAKPPLPPADIDSFMKISSLSNVSLKSWVLILGAAGSCIFLGWSGRALLVPAAPNPPAASSTTWATPSPVPISPSVSYSPVAAPDHYTLVTRPIVHKGAKDVHDCVEKFRRAFDSVGVPEPIYTAYSASARDFELSFQTADEKIVVICYKDLQSKLVMSAASVETKTRTGALNRWTLILAKVS